MGRTPSGRGRRDGDAELARIERDGAAAIRREIAGLASDDIVEVEMEAGSLLGDWRATWPDERKPLDAFGTAILRRLGAMDDPDVFALLLAVSAIAEPPLDAVAREGVARLRAAGVPEPLWSRSVGQPTLVDAWISTDPLEDQSNVVSVWSYGGRMHGLIAMVDYNFRGLIRHIGVTPDPDGYREEWRTKSGMPIRPLSEQDLADRLANGVEMFDVYLDPPVYDEVPGLIPLVRARLRLLPTPRPIEVREVPEKERRRIVREFVASPEAAGLGRVRDDRPAGKGRRSSWPAAEVADSFVDFACDYGAGDPLRWSPIAVEILLADWLPGKAILSPAEINALPDVLRAFVRYCARLKGLAPDEVAETLEAIDQFAGDFAAGMADDEAAGQAKRLWKELLASGIDLTDADAVQTFMSRWDAEERDPAR